MKQAADAFKMRYRDKTTETFVSFAKKYTNRNPPDTKALYDRVNDDDDRTIHSAAVLGYN